MTFKEVFAQYYLDLFTQLLNALQAPPVVVNPQNQSAEAALL
jgi:hypothetical protein